MPVSSIPNNYYDEIKNVKLEDYFKNNQFAVNSYKDKYCLNEQEKEYPAQAFKRVCDSIASTEITEELRTYWSNRWLWEIWNDWWKPAGSIMQGAGNSKKISLSNCTTIDIKDDSLEEIFESGKRIAKAAAYRQGLGTDISILRPKGAEVGNSAKYSTGSIEWMKWLNNIGSHVGQKGRIPAMLYSTNIKHPDVLDFIKSKSNLNAVQNANISVQITDVFMEAYEEDKNWELYFNIKNGQQIIKQNIRAKELMTLLSTEANNYAEPGVQFIDTAKRESVTGALDFPVLSTNACCLSAETRVLTRSGHYLIKDLINKEVEVWDGNSWCTVSDFNVTNTNQPMLKITLHDGSFERVTHNHNMILEDGTKIKAKDLKINDKLRTSTAPTVHGTIANTVISVENDGVDQEVYCCTVDTTKSFSLSSGIHIGNSEKFMYPDSTCVLASINVGKFSNTLAKYKDSLAHISQSITRFLDNTVEYELVNNKVPYPRQHEVISQLREVGCGIVNLHGWLFNQGLSYDEDKAIKKAEEFIKNYSYYSWKTSIDLGKEKGNCLAFNQSKLVKNPFIQRLKEEFEDLDFKTLRNSQVMSIAPTGTLSLMFSEPIISTGIEPTIGLYYWKRARTSGKYIWYFVVPAFVRETLLKSGIELPFEGESVEDNSGEIGEKCKKIIDRYYPPDIFKPAHKIDPLKKVELMGKFAKWIDSSMSVTYNLPEDSTAELVEQIYHQAWKQGIKSVSVYRDKSREGIIEFESPKTVSKRFIKADSKELTLERPATLKSNLHHVTVKGKKYIVIIGLLNNKPYEVFAGEQEEIEVPNWVKNGIVEKAASRKYNLYLAEKGKEEVDVENSVKIKDIIKQFNNDSYADLTRMLSTSLRYNVPIEEITDQLDKVESDITSFSKAVSRVLKQYLDGQDINENCPQCDNLGLVSESGCLKCLNCGYSKCL